MATNYADRAQQLFEQGCQCAQAVFCAFCDVTGCSMQQALALSSSFGGGIGRLRETCGALSGMLMALGMCFGNYEPGDAAGKDAHYRLTQYATSLFCERTGSLYCYSLLAIPHVAQIPVSEPRTAAFYHSRPCVHAIRAAADVLETILQKHADGTLATCITPQAAEVTTARINKILSH